jgi:hypothetical protein
LGLTSAQTTYDVAADRDSYLLLPLARLVVRARGVEREVVRDFEREAVRDFERGAVRDFDRDAVRDFEREAVRDFVPERVVFDFEREVFAFEREVFAFEREVFAFERDVFAFERVVFAFEREVFAFERVVFAFEREVFALEREVFAFDREVLDFERDVLDFFAPLREVFDFVPLERVLERDFDEPERDVERWRSSPSSSSSSIPNSSCIPILLLGGTVGIPASRFSTRATFVIAHVTPSAYGGVRTHHFFREIARCNCSFDMRDRPSMFSFFASL